MELVTSFSISINGGRVRVVISLLASMLRRENEPILVLRKVSMN